MIEENQHNERLFQPVILRILQRRPSVNRFQA